MRFSPSTADVSFLRKASENLSLLRAHIGGRRAPVDFREMFQQLEEYAAWLSDLTGRHLGQSRVLEIGYGARPWRLVALMSMGVQVIGVDAEVPFLSAGWGEIRAALRINGMERVAKSLVRHRLVDKREKAALARELAGHGHALHIERSRFLVSDAALLDFPDGAFDLIYSEDVFEHIPRPSLEALVPKMARWLRPGGLGLIRPNVFTGILGGHLAEWTYASVLNPPPHRRETPWEHLRSRRFPPNTYLNELPRSAYRELFSRQFDIVSEVVSFPDFGRNYLTGEVAEDLAAYPEEELFSNRVLFVLRPR